MHSCNNASISHPCSANTASRTTYLQNAAVGLPRGKWHLDFWLHDLPPSCVDQNWRLPTLLRSLPHKKTGHSTSLSARRSVTIHTYHTGLSSLIRARRCTSYLTCLQEFRSTSRQSTVAGLKTAMGLLLAGPSHEHITWRAVCHQSAKCKCVVLY